MKIKKEFMMLYNAEDKRAERELNKAVGEM